MPRLVASNMIAAAAVVIAFSVTFAEAHSPILIGKCSELLSSAFLLIFPLYPSVPGVEGSQLFKIQQPCKEPLDLCFWEGVWVGFELCTDTASAVQDLA